MVDSLVAGWWRRRPKALLFGRGEGQRRLRCEHAIGKQASQFRSTPRARLPHGCDQCHTIAIRSAFEYGPRCCLATLLFRARVFTALQSMRERGRRRIRRAPHLLAGMSQGCRRQWGLPVEGALVLGWHTRVPGPTSSAGTQYPLGCAMAERDTRLRGRLIGGERNRLAGRRVVRVGLTR